MDVIPVIDVRHGVAVHARQGQRAAYRPLETPLARGTDPVAVARGFLSLFPFRTMYVADLDGIEGRGRNAELPRQLAAAGYQPASCRSVPVLRLPTSPPLASPCPDARTI